MNIRSRVFALHVVQWQSEDSEPWEVLESEEGTIAAFEQAEDARKQLDEGAAQAPHLKWRIVKYCASGYAEERSAGIDFKITSEDLRKAFTGIRIHE